MRPKRVQGGTGAAIFLSYVVASIYHTRVISPVFDMTEATFHQIFCMV